MTRSPATPPFFVLSGHFSSPAEVDPWTGLRHDYSVKENFHERFQGLSRSCYGANSASRILGAEGKIRRIVNNYRRMAFSFAPSLLEELRAAAPNVYRRIVSADRESAAQWGHGNALAQCWNPVILPLMEPRQVRLQLELGVAAFEKHFGRRPEGFWLPHQAVSPAVLDQLVELGVSWILLSPSQIEAVMPVDEGSWTPLGGSPPPFDRPLRLDRPGGSLGVFVEHSELTRGLTEGQYLRDASRLHGAILGALADHDFATVTADGNLFGQVEPFADMCLAALWEKLSGGETSEVQVANYGVLWERFPPTHQVRLKKGDNEEGTSRDCPHGVARWKSDCGCRSGGDLGWNQRWRAPLFAQLTGLERKVHQGLGKVLQTLGVSEAALTAALPELATKKTPPAAWAQKLLGKTTPDTENRLLRWVQGYLSAQAMLTSDLWHEADPLLPTARSGFLSALYCLELISPEAEGPLLQEFLRGLEIDGNNEKTLRRSVEDSVMKRKHGIEFPAALFLFDRLLRTNSWYEDALGPYVVKQFTRNRQEVQEGVIRYTGLLELEQADLRQSWRLEFLLLEDQTEGVTLTLKKAGSSEKPRAFDLEWLPVGERTEIVQRMGADLEANLASEAQAIFPLLRKSLVYSRLLDVPPLPMARSLMDLAVTRKILELADAATLPSAEALASLEQELTFAQDFGLKLDRDRLNARFSRWLFQALSKPDDFTRESVVSAVETLLGKFLAWRYAPDITVAQSLVFEVLQDRFPDLLQAVREEKAEAAGELQRLLRLGDLLSIDTTELRRRLETEKLDFAP